MALINYPIRIDTGLKSAQKIWLKQGSIDGVQLDFLIINNGIPVDFSGCTGALNATKPSGAVVVSYCMLQSDGHAKCIVSQQLAIEAGKLSDCYIQIFRTGEVYNTIDLDVTVVPSKAYDTEITSSSEFTVFEEALGALANTVRLTGDETITGYKSVPTPTSAAHIANKAYVDSYSPVGEIKIWPTATAPVGFLLCNGSLLSRSTFADLFAVLGTVYGAGDGSTTFALPNLRGKVVAGKTASGTFSTLGAAVGSETVALTGEQNGQHYHGFSNGYLDGAQMNGTPNRHVACAGGGSTPGGVATSNSGAGSAHNNIQPTVVMNYIIRAYA